MEQHDLRGRLALALAQLRLPELRQVARLQPWTEIVRVARELPDEQLEQIIRHTFDGELADDVLLGLRVRSAWLTHRGSVTPEEEQEILNDLTTFAAFLGCGSVPSKIRWMPTGSPRYRQDAPLDPAWVEALRHINDFSADLNPGFECGIVNAVVHDAPLDNIRLARSYFANTFVGGHAGAAHPWYIPWRMACRGFLLEAIYVDGTAQVATRVL